MAVAFQHAALFPGMQIEQVNAVIQAGQGNLAAVGGGDGARGDGDRPERHAGVGGHERRAHGDHRHDLDARGEIVAQFESRYMK